MGNTTATEPALESLGEGVTESLNRDAVKALSAHEPEWLRQRRLHAWSVYERTPLPTTRLEEWRYTDLSRKLKLEELTPASVSLEGPAVAPDDFPTRLRQVRDEDRDSAGELVEIDGRTVHRVLSDELRDKGVILTSLRDAVHSHEEVLREHLATQILPPEAGKFQALNSAFWTDGVLLVVPQGVRVELPIRVSRWISEAGRCYFSRVLLVAEEGSQVSYVDEALSSDLEEQSLFSSGVEVVAHEGAQVQFASLQRMGRGTFHLSQQRTLAHRDATLDTLNVTLGASVSRLDLNAQLLGPGANSDMLGLYFGEDDQHFDHNTSQDHRAPHTKSDLLYKGALEDRARAVFRGVIKVHKGAQQTDAFQTNRNLLLSETARADSLPNLEISADDVRCSHGATVGQLDEEALFYLMSRGLTRHRAERLVVQGFLGEVLSRFPLGGVVEKVSGVIKRRLESH